MKKGKVVLIASGKGGVGKSFFSVNLATLLAMQGNRVVIVDLDTKSRDLDLLLGEENSLVFNISDIVNGLCSIGQGLINCKQAENLFLAGGSAYIANQNTDNSRVGKFISFLGENFEYVIIDNATGFGEEMSICLTESDATVVVSEATHSSLRASENLIAELTMKRVKNLFSIVNKADVELLENNAMPTIQKMGERLRVPMLGVIQYEKGIVFSANDGKPIVTEEGYVKENFTEIANRLFAILDK
ncbi:MAG: P-loop NTPase [Anaerovoracaceae bacterium]